MALEASAVASIQQSLRVLRRTSQPRLPSRGGLLLLDLVARYTDELANYEYRDATKTALDIMLVASRAFEETTQMALHQRSERLFFEQNYHVHDCYSGGDEVEKQRRKHRNRR